MFTEKTRNRHGVLVVAVAEKHPGTKRPTYISAGRRGVGVSFDLLNPGTHPRDDRLVSDCYHTLL